VATVKLLDLANYTSIGVSRSLVGFLHFVALVDHSLSVRLGYSDLPSRLPTQSSTLYSNNISKFLLSLTKDGQPSDQFFIDLEDQVTRGAIAVHKGEIMAPVPRVMPAPTVPPAKSEAKADESAQTLAISPWKKECRDVALVTGGMGTAVALGAASGAALMGNVFTFALAGKRLSGLSMICFLCNV
jgi:NAD(P) transhydrogenase